MALGASARTLFSSAVGVFALGVVALPANAGEIPAGTPTCDGLTPTITGTTAGEYVTGTEGDDVIRGGAGDDVIYGEGGDDIICAGPGNDTTRAGQGNDTVRSGRGDDSSSGESGDDFMRGQGDTDLADGGTGVDACFFETHEQCEADLAPTITGPSNATTGGTAVAIYNAELVNHGPTPAVNSRVSIQVPANAVFIPAVSDPRCTLFTATEIRCVFGTMGLEVPNDGDFGLTFTACAPGPVDIVGTSADPRTNDHVPANDVSTKTTTLSLDASCAQAVDDAVTVQHDTGANTIDVLANDKGAVSSVATVTNGAHGSVAITNGGANVAYTPTAQYCGPDTFTYTINPGGSQATVTVTIPCPTAVDDDFTANACSSQPSQGQIVALPPNFTDYRLDVLPNDINPPGAGPIKIASITQPTVNGSPQGSATIIENGGAILLHTVGDDFGDVYVLTYALSPGGSQATVSTHIICSEGSGSF